MSQNSNLANNSPASMHHGSPTTTYGNDDATFATQLLNKFNTQQEHHISILLTSLVQYVPSSPTLSIQEVALPPPLHICINPNPKGPHPPMSPGIAETILHRHGGMLHSHCVRWTATGHRDLGTFSLLDCQLFL